MYGQNDNDFLVISFHTETKYKGVVVINMKQKIFVLLFSIAVFSYGQDKHALVIGNSDYGTLRNAINDANDMKDILNELGKYHENELI